MSEREIDPATRRANLRLALLLALVAFGFFAAFIYMTVTSR